MWIIIFKIRFIADGIDMIKEHHGKTPVVHHAAFVAETAILIGEVQIGADSSIWYGAVLRGDINSITIGKRTSIQDNCVVHVETDMPVFIGDDVTVGHGAILHGCKIGNGVLIGMGAIILDGVKIGDGAVVAAGAVVKERTIIPPATLVAGIPAMPKKNRLDDEVKKMLISHAARYVEHSKTYK